MKTLLYDTLVSFYHLLDPLEEHADEAEELGSVLRDAVPDGQRLLELGAGAGHGAHYIQTKFYHVTLTDLSAPMLARSKALNPECEHLVGDMRTLRLGRPFDCVLIHDAIAYITTPEDLSATAATAFEHLRAQGAALLIPDCVKETFVESHEDHAGDDAERSLRCISWSYDPDPDDDTHLTDFAFLLREYGEVRAVHDRHVHGLFTTDTWVHVCEQAGFQVDIISRPLPAEYVGTGYTDKMFLCRKG
jgi:SAM-dependent methyltransferase